MHMMLSQIHVCFYSFILIIRILLLQYNLTPSLIYETLVLLGKNCPSLVSAQLDKNP